MLENCPVPIAAPLFIPLFFLELVARGEGLGLMAAVFLLLLLLCGGSRKGGGGGGGVLGAVTGRGSLLASLSLFAVRSSFGSGGGPSVSSLLLCLGGVGCVAATELLLG